MISRFIERLALTAGPVCRVGTTWFPGDGIRTRRDETDSFLGQERQVLKLYWARTRFRASYGPEVHRPKPIVPTRIEQK